MTDSALDDFADAINADDATTVQSMIDNESIDVNARLPRDHSPPALVFAASLNRLAIVELLLRANADVDNTDDSGMTACMAAAARGPRHNDMLALLVTRRPNLGLKESSGSTAIQFAFAFERNERAWLLLLEAGAALDDLEGVLFARLLNFVATSTAAIRAVLGRGVVVRELRSKAGETPLHKAAALASDMAALSMLVNVCGVDLEARDSNSRTCIHHAVERHKVDALRWLIDAGADVESVDKYDLTPLHRARDYSCSIVLLAAGAVGHTRCQWHRSMVHSAALAQSPEMAIDLVHALLGAGADLDTADELGETARDVLSRRGLAVDSDRVDAARRDIAKTRLDFTRNRALQVCVGLQSLGLDALQMCEILQFACWPVAPHVRFDQWWKIATTVKHFHQRH